MRAKKYWMHRISYCGEISWNLLEKDILSYGFSEFSYEKDILTCDKTGFDNIFKEVWNELPRTRHQLWQYLREMKTGDWVIVPSPGHFSVYEITGEHPLLPEDIAVDDLKTSYGDRVNLSSEKLLCYTDSTGNIHSFDLGFFWNVKPIAKNIPRNEYASGPLSSRLKTQFTQLDLTDLEKDIEQAVIKWEEKKPISLYSSLVANIAQETLKTIINTLTPERFEKLIVWYLYRIGAKEAWIPPKNEKEKQGDADIIAIFDNLKVVIYVQAKKHIGVSSDWAVSQVSEYKYYKTSTMDNDYTALSWVISTAQFTNETYKKAKEQSVRLIDGQSFIQLLLDCGLDGIDNAFQ